VTARRSQHGGIVGHQQVHAADTRVHPRRADIVRRHAAQPTTFDHGRPAHADAAAFGGDDDIATAQQCRIAGEAAPADHADQRHPARQRGQPGKRRAVQPGDNRPVDIAGPTPAAFGPQQQRQVLAAGEVKQAVALLVVEGALRSGEHGVVVDQQRHRLAVHRGRAGDHAVSRCLALQLLERAPAALGGHGERAEFDEAAGIGQPGHDLARGPPPGGVSRGHGSRPG
jgi:hypothetical protein